MSEEAAPMTTESLTLTDEQIEQILDELHEEVQFYNSRGEADNRNVLEQVKAVLRDKFMQDEG